MNSPLLQRCAPSVGTCQATPVLVPVNHSTPACCPQYLTECTFNWRMIKGIVTECHVYDKENNYKPFDFEKESALLTFQRKVLPNSM